MTAEQLAHALLWEVVRFYLTGVGIMMLVLAAVFCIILFIGYARDRLQLEDWIWLPCFALLIGVVMLALRAYA